MTVVRAARPARVRPEGYVGIVTRAVALVIDAAAVNVIAIVIGACVQLLISLFSGHTDLGPAAALFTGVGWFFWAGLYFTVFWDLTGETPGNRVMGIRVTSVDGGNVHLVEAILRYVGLVLALASLGLGFLPVLFNERRRGLHDWMGGTVVRWVEPVDAAGVEPVPVGGSAARARTQGAASLPAAPARGRSVATGKQGPRLS